MSTFSFANKIYNFLRLLFIPILTKTNIFGLIIKVMCASVYTEVKLLLLWQIIFSKLWIFFRDLDYFSLKIHVISYVLTVCLSEFVINFVFGTIMCPDLITPSWKYLLFRSSSLDKWCTFDSWYMTYAWYFDTVVLVWHKRNHSVPTMWVVTGSMIRKTSHILPTHDTENVDKDLFFRCKVEKDWGTVGAEYDWEQ